MQEEQLKELLKQFTVLPDPRVDRGLNQPLVNIIVIALCAVLSDAESFYDIEDFGNIKREWLSGFLDLTQGIPSHDTFGRVFARLDPHHFQACFLDWVRSVIQGKLTAGDVVSIDGKTLCGSARSDIKAVHMLNVWSHQHGLCLTQAAVDTKSNEITALPTILDTLALLELAGCIVTVDAMGTQREVARKLIAMKAHYVMALKRNQGTLHEDAMQILEYQQPDDIFETSERGHGRQELRRCEVFTDIAYLEEHKWPGLVSFARITCTRTIGGNTREETRLYLSSLPGDAPKILHAIRAHWEIENKLHWTLDVVFGEDAHSYAKDHGPENMAILRQLALNLLKREPSSTALKRKRKHAALSDAYRTSLLALL